MDCLLLSSLDSHCLRVSRCLCVLQTSCIHRCPSHVFDVFPIVFLLSVSSSLLLPPDLIYLHCFVVVNLFFFFHLRLISCFVSLPHGVTPPLLSSSLLSTPFHSSPLIHPTPPSLLPPIRHRLPETLSNWWRCQTMVGPWESTWCLSVAGTAGKNIHSCRGAAPNKVDHSYGEERVKVIVFPT